MKIEIWSDFACPFCYIAKRNLEQALTQFNGKADVVFRAFELDPHAGGTPEATTAERLQQKYGKTEAEALAMIQNVEQKAQAVGIEMHYATTQFVRTFEAHRLAKFAAEKGLGMAMQECLFKAYFTENLNLAKRVVLIDLAVEMGLDRFDVAELLTGDDFGHDVRGDEIEANRLGIQSVPYFLINGKTIINGAQSAEDILAALNEAD
jgi:predicted DsbA family dithiol-disulfide isomerase